MNLQRQYQNGIWYDEDEPERLIAMAAEHHGVSESVIRQRLESTNRRVREVRYRADDWYPFIRIAPPPRRPRRIDYPDGRKLDCGCTVEMACEVMSASRGTSCEACYDRMSD